MKLPFSSVFVSFFILIQSICIYTDLRASPCQASELKVLTLNTWALSFPINAFMPFPLFEVRIAPDADARMTALCEVLSEGAKADNWDIVLLQEVWNQRDREKMKACGYPYFADLDQLGTFRHFDSGLLILSRFPVEDTKRYVYHENGSWRHPLNGEYFVRKSGIMAKIVHPLKGPVWVANTHLVARYPQVHFAEQRAEQLFDFYIWARAQALKLPLVFGGDFNLDLLSPHRDSDDEDAISFLRVFPDFLRWSENDQATSSVDNEWANENAAGLIDFIFATQKNFLPIAGGLTFHDTFYESKNQGPRHLSDHYGWNTTFEWLDKDLEMPIPPSHQ